MKIRTFTSAALFSLVATGVQAQQSVATALKLTEAAPQSSALSAASGVQISASQGDETVSLKLGFERSHDGVFDTFSLGAETPLSKNGSKTDIATLDGLTGSTNITFGIRRLWAHGRQRVPHPDSPICREMLRLKSEATGKTDDQCDSEAFATYDRAHLAEFQRMSWGVGPSVDFLGLNGKVGYQDFDDVALATARSETVRKTSWSVSGFYARQWPANGTLVNLTAKYQDTYSDQDPGVLCPAGSGPILTCAAGPLGPPAHKTGALASIEVRQALGRFAVGATVTYDFKQEVTGVDLPIYLIPDGDNGLTGGLRLGWRSDKDDVTAGVFITKAFSTVPY